MMTTHCPFGYRIDAKQQKSLIAPEYGKKDGVKVIADFAPYTNHTIVQNHDEAPEAINHLKVALVRGTCPNQWWSRAQPTPKTRHFLQRLVR
jgi:hypothetical protein